MSGQSQFDLPGRAYPFPKCLPAVLTSLVGLQQAKKPLRSNQGSVPSPTALDLRHFRWCSSHFVSRQRIPCAGEVQFPLVTNSLVFPSRCGCGRRALTRHCRSSLQCRRSCYIRPELVTLSSFLATDRRPQGAWVSDVKRGKLPGHIALPDERVRAVCARHRGQCQA